MNYNFFKNTLNSRIFGDDLNYEILLTVLNNPKRYIGLFRITNAKTKLIQNLTQSCEIKFGDFLEEILTEYINEMGYENLNKQIGLDEENNPLNADQIFQKENIIYLIEQKVRDDHDSTKKRGQYANLVKKIRCLKHNFPNSIICANMWFSDDSLKKNKKYYTEMINSNTDSMITISLHYGKEIFENLFDRIDIWDELISHLQQNKIERSKEILSVPDFDSSSEILEALLKIKRNEPKLIKKLLSNKPEFIELKNELFPTGKNLDNLND
ncbi:HpyAIV family type II restriction enzyme [Campylobacter fetus]|uniref:HpyAIV family type II restriction enzyme n=1 Tax=Campylobacter fetus TaxID=196 RepID=UPI000818A9B7|nr:restriction endonuclease [Campylobacter fetus]OCR92515.1 restriction endonuclease [Campylobacter fetus subsp. testudinum]OCS00496.1 restriction endonuclease [Campylobacter fetus subsp. testudinum]